MQQLCRFTAAVVNISQLRVDVIQLSVRYCGIRCYSCTCQFVNFLLQVWRIFQHWRQLWQQHKFTRHNCS